MAFYPPMRFLSLFLSLALLHLTLCFGTQQRLSDAVHDALPSYGLPKGLVPDTVEAYSLADDGSFEIRLPRPCYVRFDYLVYYEKTITGKLSYGKITNLSGIQAKKFFLWVSVSAIAVDAADNQIEFFVGFISEKLPADQFEKIPTCKSRACGGRGRKEAALLAQA